MQNQQINSKKTGLFSSLLFLTIFLILVEISFLTQCSGLYLGDVKLVSHHLSVPLNVLPGIGYFIFAQLLVHFIFTVLVWGVARLVGKVFNCSWKATERLGLVLWFIALMTLLLLNNYFFPNSKFSTVLFGPINHYISGGFTLLFSLVSCCAILIAVYGFVRYSKKISLFVSLGLVGLIGFLNIGHSASSDAATIEKPNIIIIGVDSLRPDFLGFFGYAKITPHIDNFLNHSTVFAESLTPLARTYPSWVSILTGLYPKLSSVRTNLSDQSQLDFNSTLPALLRQNGYKTIFATDETRFSNIDQQFGFDQVVIPPIGFNDFLLGTVNDFPFSNLLVNTVIGKYLFPHSYANRAVIATYQPNSFLHLLRPVLAESRNKPVFLVTHFCLPHFPYAWASLPVKKVSLHHYQSAVIRADQQFYDFMKMLKKDHLLEHSIVVLLSDHGEAVEIPGDRITDARLFIPGKNNPKNIVPHFYPPSSEHEKVDMSGGHGTDVLGLSQYHTVLAFRSFGLKPAQKKVIPGIVSVMDIKPTLLDYLKIQTGKMSGKSLQDNIFGSRAIAILQKDFFTESDFSPEAIRSVHPEERKVLFEGIDYFRIDQATARIVVRDSMLKLIISSKQYADYRGEWVLALYPQNKTEMMPILVNINSGKWTNDLTTPFAEHSPAKQMLAALRKFFGGDITHVENVT
ncbi:MAG: sulfatase-like hydrolase/transferase [Gammaproteobacteria bacterium]